MSEEKYVRPTWDEYFMKIAEVVGERSTCDRGRVGCVIARDKQILATGYAGAPKGLPHCDEVGHEMTSVTHPDRTITHHCVRTTHAEQNAIVQAAKVGTSIDGATIYCKITPCSACAKMIINAGIRRVVCAKKYHAGQESEELFLRSGVELDYFDNSVEQYENQ